MLQSVPGSRGRSGVFCLHDKEVGCTFLSKQLGEAFQDLWNAYKIHYVSKSRKVIQKICLHQKAQKIRTFPSPAQRCTHFKLCSLLSCWTDEKKMELSCFLQAMFCLLTEHGSTISFCLVGRAFIQQKYSRKPVSVSEGRCWYRGSSCPRSLTLSQLHGAL